MIDSTAKDLTIESPSDVQRATLSKLEIERERDARMERSIRMAMAAKEDSEGNCFYCGRKLDVEHAIQDGRAVETKLHPMPYLECKGPSTNSRVAASGRIERTLVALAPVKRELPDLRPVVRPFGERD